MAYNKHDIQDVTSYMDGVPVKISEKFRPPRKVTLPVGFMTRLETTLESTLQDTSFDFSLARSVAKNSGYRKAQKEIVREERRARIAQGEQLLRQQRDKELTDQLEKLNMKMEKAEIECKAKESTPPVSPVTKTVPEIHQQVQPNVGPQLSTAILTPVLLAAPKNSSESKTNSNSFNFKDFENDTSSPFDNVELKTINDLEELAHVLHLEAPPAANPAPSYNFDSRNNNSYAESRYFYPPQAPTPGSAASNQFYYPQQQTWSYPHPYNHTSSTKENHPFPATVYSQANDVRYHFPSAAASHESSARTSKSVPDIMEELQKEATTSRTAAVQVPRVEAFKTETHNSFRPASFGSTGLENWKPWPDLDSPAETPSGDSPPPAAPVVTRAAGNTLERLNPEAQKLARQISEMGFPVAKVVRACKIIGEDHKKVVDFLLQVQALEEKGFPDTKVEYVLGTLKLDEQRAQQFLPVFVQLVDLGFAEEKVSAALIQSGCDRDKALDALLS
ncbi:ubiquitin-associated protein 1 [Neocloeon triangulifer]|uniref:ubiquitin-associated protein 1 n=1 Tax=Neocloeon triangulifer TaxID=2078957 RepID=UPI00286ED28F|nr:ubiquitin-associated protein 1 [Neocloeon triangulifer]XP_059478900.1 ubiquitin-associated protein 1 [Neocloeon triangulifer]XP_059478901.1 ubiquitin-associated protein 1 [Neocloeon triangulifer]